MAEESPPEAEQQTSHHSQHDYRNYEKCPPFVGQLGSGPRLVGQKYRLEPVSIFYRRNLRRGYISMGLSRELAPLDNITLFRFYFYFIHSLQL